jgi:hypothetical protein
MTFFLPVGEKAPKKDVWQKGEERDGAELPPPGEMRNVVNPYPEEAPRDDDQVRGDAVTYPMRLAPAAEKPGNERLAPSHAHEYGTRRGRF